jgi:hypothetical protein
LRAAHLIPLLALMAAVGVIATAHFVKRALRSTQPWVVRNASALLLLTAATVMGFELLRRYQNYFNEYPHNEIALGGFEYGLEEVLDYALAHDSPYREVWITDAPQPYMYLLFYAKWPPSEVHRSLQVRRSPPSSNRVDTFGKYRFGNPPNAWRQELPLLYAVPYPGSDIMYQVRGGEVSDRGAILLVHRCRGIGVWRC